MVRADRHAAWGRSELVRRALSAESDGAGGGAASGATCQTGSRPGRGAVAPLVLDAQPQRLTVRAGDEPLAAALAATLAASLAASLAAARFAATSATSASTSSSSTATGYPTALEW